MKLLPASILLLVALSLASTLGAQDSETFKPKGYPEVYKPTWESLYKHGSAPEWLLDAKLGIYFHWGPYTVPAYKNEWYPRWMQHPNPKKWGKGIREHHTETYGPPSEFGYHHFIPMFTAEHFDAENWAELFASAGARFAGPVAQHHDGFSMWDSKLNPNNAAAEGPKKDITGLLLTALRKRGMKTIATFHHSFTGQRSRDGEKKGQRALSYYPYSKDLFTSSEDPKLRKLYGNMPEAEFNDYWLGLVQEVIDNYQPDIIWFDSWLDVIPEDHRKRAAAYHFNAGAAQNRDVAFACKQQDMPDEMRILDIEQGGMKETPQRAWMTDITLSSSGGWCYVKNQKYRPVPLLVRNMIDVWSKRGVVLLNVSPEANGVIADQQRVRLKGLGDWMKVYGEAVYDTRPHTRFGYGNAKIKDGSHGGQSSKIKYSQSDVRFTKSKDGKTLYVFLLGQPESGAALSIKHLGDDRTDPGVSSVSVLGTQQDCEWKFVDGELQLTAPQAGDFNAITTVFKVELE